MPVVTATDALLIIDMQVDFLPGGALAVTGADALVPVINQLGHLPFGLVVATQDWHPADHVSFRKRGGPGRCIAWRAVKGPRYLPRWIRPVLACCCVRDWTAISTAIQPSGTMTVSAGQGWKDC